jgi:hypothetical protein
VDDNRRCSVRIVLRYDGPNGAGLPQHDEYFEVEISGEPNTLPGSVQSEASVFLITNATYNGLRVYRRIWPAPVRNA